MSSFALQNKLALQTSTANILYIHVIFNDNFRSSWRCRAGHKGKFWWRQARYLVYSCMLIYLTFTLVRTFCSSNAKTSAVTPIFYFMVLIRAVLPFDEQKNWHKPMLSFLAILLNCTDWAITGRIARVQFNCTLELKAKTRALKGIFLVRKWMQNTFKSNFVRYHMSYRKNLSFLSSFGLRAVFVKGS